MKDDIVNLPDCPRVHPSVDFAFVKDGSVLVRGHDGSAILTGEFVQRALPRVLPMLDGTRTMKTLVAEVGIEYQPEFETFLQIMSDRRYLYNGPQYDDPNHARRTYWDLHAKSAEAALQSLDTAEIVIAGDGAVAEALSKVLKDAGANKCRQVSRATLTDSHQGQNANDMPRKSSADPFKDAAIIVVVSDGMSLVGVDEVNESALLTKVPWMLVRIDRSTALIGPYVMPGQSACFTCYELRARANAEHPLEHEALFNTWRETVDTPTGSNVSPEYAAIVANWVALDVMRTVVSGRPSPALGRILVLDLNTLGSETRDILRLPRCPVCSRQKTLPLTRIWETTKVQDKKLLGASN